MKKLVFAILLLFSFCLKAQEISVSSFERKTNDLDAKVNYPVIDQNGDKCALLKIATTESGFDFAAGQLGIMKTERKIGEYWVYIPYGSKRITIKHNDFGVLRDYVFPESIDKATVYVMTLHCAYSNDAINTKDKGYFTVRTSPSNVTINMEGNPVFNEKSPYIANTNQTGWPIGKMKLLFEKDEYYPKDTIILIRKDKVSEIEIELKPKFSYAKFNLKPKDSYFEINGHKSSSEKQKFFKSEIIVKATHEHYYPYVDTIQIEDGGNTYDYEINLNPIIGSLSLIEISDISQNAKVFLNDNEIGALPINDYELIEGEYKLKVVKQGHEVFEKIIKIEENKNTKVQVDLDDLTNIKLDNINSPVSHYIKNDTVHIVYKASFLVTQMADVKLYYTYKNLKTLVGIKNATGDIGKVLEPGVHEILFVMDEQMLSHKETISFFVKAETQKKPIPHHWYAAYNISGSSAFGVTVGTVGSWGWYLRLKSNGKLYNSDLHTNIGNSNEIINYQGDGYYTYTDNLRYNRIAITAGIIQVVYPNLFIYIGGGYGERTVFWHADEFSYVNDEKTSDLWIVNDFNSHKGFELDAGIFYKYKFLNFSIGCNTIGFDFFEINGGIGVNF